MRSILLGCFLLFSLPILPQEPVIINIPQARVPAINKLGEHIVISGEFEFIDEWLFKIFPDAYANGLNLEFEYKNKIYGSGHFEKPVNSKLAKWSIKVYNNDLSEDDCKVILKSRKFKILLADFEPKIVLWSGN